MKRFTFYLMLLFTAIAFEASAQIITYSVTVPAGTNVCYIAGDMNGWTQQSMTKVDNTHWTISFSSDHMNDGYKYCSGPGWAFVEKDSTGADISNRVYSPADVVKKWAMVYDPNGDIIAPSAPTGLKFTPPVDNAFYLSWQAATDNVAVVGYDVFKDSVYYGSSITLGLNITGLSPGKTYKMTVRARDAAGNQSISSNPLLVTNSGSAGITYNVTVPSGTNMCYFAGSINNWDPTANPMTKVDPTHYTIYFPNALATDEYKYCSGPGWSFVEKDSVGAEITNRTWNANDRVLSWLLVYDPSKVGTIFLKVTAPAETNKVWILGDFLGWDMTKAIEGIKNADGKFMFNIPSVMSIQYRFYNQPDWDHPEVGVVDPAELPARYTIYSADTTNIIVWGWKIGADSIVDKSAPSAPTGLKNTQPTTTSFYLSWQPSTDNVGVVGYEVYKDSAYYATTTSVGLDITGLTPGKTYKLTVKAKDAAGNLSVASAALYVTTLPDITTGITFNVKVPTGTYQCWIVGNFNNWNNNLNQMTRVDSTHYTITLYESTFAPGITKDSLQYKYLSGGGDWAYVEKDSVGGEIPNRLYHSNDIVGSWNTVYNPNILPLPMDFTVTVTTPAGTNECYIVGSFNNWAGPTDPGCKMTKISTNTDGSVVFSISGHTDDANKFVYHFCSGPDWTFEQKTPVGDFKYPIVNPVVTEWKALYDRSKTGTVHIKATVPAGTNNVWILGSYLGWDMTKAVEGLKNSDGTFSFTVSNIMMFEYKLYNKADWGFAEIDATGAERVNRTASYPADSITNITVIGWKQIVDTISNNGILIQIGTGGTVIENNFILKTGDFIMANQGATKTFIIKPDAGYKVESLYFNGLDVKSQLVNNQFTTPVVNGSITLSVTFQKIQYRLSIKSAESGVISLICEYGATPTFEFTPAENWGINVVMFNGYDITATLANGIFMVPPITQDVTINISFVLKTALYTPSSSNVKVYSANSDIIIEGIPVGEIVRLFTENGATLKILKSQGDRMVIPALPDAIYLVKTSSKTVKIIL